MSKVKIKGLTPSTITFNSIELVLQGEKEATVDVISEEDEREIAELENAGLIAVRRKRESRGRPKGSKNKNSKDHAPKKIARTDKVTDAVSDYVHPDDANSINNAEGSSVVAVSGNGKVVTGEMTNRVEGTDESIENSEAGQRSIAAMKKLEAEERGEYVEDQPIDESKLDLSEQMGLEVVISTGNDIETVRMKNSVVPEANPVTDSFIDKADKEEIAVIKAQQKADAKAQKKADAKAEAKVEAKVEARVEDDDNFDPFCEEEPDGDDPSKSFIEM